MFQVARKFRVLQVGGHDLGSLFNQKSNVEWDYFDVGLFDFESGYQDVVVHILDEKGQFDFVFVREKYSDSLMKLLSLVSTPYNTVIDNEYWDNQYQQDKTIQRNFIKPLIYENEEQLQQKLHFLGNMEIKLNLFIVALVFILMVLINLMEMSLLKYQDDLGNHTNPSLHGVKISLLMPIR